MISSSVHIGTACLKDVARTDRLRQKMRWQGAATYGRGKRFGVSNHACRYCQYAQIQGRALVCLLAAMPTQKRAVCSLYSFGALRLYQEPGHAAHADGNG